MTQRYAKRNTSSMGTTLMTVPAMTRFHCV